MNFGVELGMEALDGVIVGEWGWDGGRDRMASSTLLKEVRSMTIITG